jgi:UDP-glucose 4-epimerase
VQWKAGRGEVFNLGADVPYTLNELARLVAAAMGQECRVKHLDPRNEVKVAFSDHSKINRLLGPQRKTPLEDGIRRMAQWVKAHGPRPTNIFGEIEVAKNLPASWASLVTRDE